MAEAMLKELTEARDILLHEVEIKHDGIEALKGGGVLVKKILQLLLRKKTHKKLKI